MYGLGHPFVMTIGGVQLLYQLNQANGHIDSDQLIVHTLMPNGTHPLASLPDLGYLSPFASPMGNYPTLEASAEATVGLKNPDAILGAVPIGGKIALVYVEKQLNASTSNNCMKTPSWALTNIDTKKARNPNTDIITIRVATTTEGINFTDVGPASGLQDPTTTAFNGIRWLGSGSLIALSNGHCGPSMTSRRMGEDAPLAVIRRGSWGGRWAFLRVSTTFLEGHQTDLHTTE
jgi:hypothetical protein